ncbi:MAG: signal peptidase I [Dermatophilaceae bacterium]
MPIEPTGPAERAADKARASTLEPEASEADPQESAKPEAEGAGLEQDEPSGRSLGEAIWAGLRELAIVLGSAMVLSLVVKSFLVQPFHIPSGSMENTLVRDDRVVVSKLTPRFVALSRGDVVVFTDPDHWLGELPEVPRSPVSRLLVFLGLAPDDSNDHLIKRIIGLPGDHVACCDKEGKVTVNGVAISEPYLKPGDTPGGGRAPFSITVPMGRVWVMGDHRSDSSDSRLHDDGTGAKGSIPIDKITGRAVAVVWPVDHITWLAAPERVFGSVPATPPALPSSSSRAPGAGVGSAPVATGTP